MNLKTNKEILEAAIKKAIDNGWKCPSLIIALYADASSTFEHEGQHVEMIRGVITGHDFAKALWGKGEVCKEEGGAPVIHLHEGTCDCEMSDEWGSCNVQPAFQYHLQQMVISEDPIKYLGDNI